VNEPQFVLIVNNQYIKINLENVCYIRELWGRQKRKETKPVQYQEINEK